MRYKPCILSLSFLLATALCTCDTFAGILKMHGIFSSNMVIQRDKPITIWGWAETGHTVSVRFGQEQAEATAVGEAGRWEVAFPARQANATGQKLTANSGNETIELDDILVGDIWVMNGQSNMAFGLGATYRADLETATAHLPLLRRVGIAPNESYTLLEDPEHTDFIPAYDQQLPGLHTKKKHFLATRAARWALNEVYGMRVDWETAELVSAERDGEQMVLTFDRLVAPDDNGPIEGFAIAGEDGKYYRAYAESLVTKDQGIWGNKYDRTKLFVWSPLVRQPVAVRYAWARSPMGNLKVNGKPWQTLHSFRTDEWDWPENEDPSENAVTRSQSKQMAQEAAERVEYRSAEEAKQAVEILKQRALLGKKD